MNNSARSQKGTCGHFRVCLRGILEPAAAQVSTPDARAAAYGYLAKLPKATS